MISVLWPIDSPVRGSTTAGSTGLKCLGRSAEPRRQPLPGAAAAGAGEQQLLIGARVDDRRIADGIGAAGDAGVDLAERDLVADVDRGFEARAAGTLHVEPRGVRIEAARQHALAHQVVVARVLDHRAGGHIPETLALKLETLHHGAQRGREHVLVAGGSVSRIGAGERNAHATDDGDASDRRSDQHDSSPKRDALECHGQSGDAIGSVRMGEYYHDHGPRRPRVSGLARGAARRARAARWSCCRRSSASTATSAR